MQYGFSQLRFRILAGVASVLALFVAVFAWQAYSSYTTAIDNAENVLQSQVLALKEHGERALSEADHALQTTIAQIAMRGGIKQLDRDMLTDIMLANRSGIPQIGVIAVLDATGRIIASTSERKAKLPDASQRGFFIFHRDNTTQKTHIGSPIRSYISGKWHFSLSRRLTDRSNRFAGVAVVLFDISYFQRLYRSMVTRNDGRVYLASHSGDFLVLVPHDEKIFATGQKTGATLRTYLAHRLADTYHNRNASITGDYRIISYNSLDSFPVVAIMSARHDRVTAAWRAATLQQGVAVAGLCTLSIFLAWLFIGKLREREETNRTLERQKKELDERAELIRLIMESTCDAIYGIDPQGLCIFANTACVRMLGYEHREELLGRNMHDLIHHSFADSTPMDVNTCRIFNAYRNGVGVTVTDEVFWKKDGSSFPVEYSSYPILNKEEKIVGAVITWRDISDRLKANEERLNLEKQLLHAQKLESLGILAGGIAHDFNNILTAIIGNADLALTRLNPESPARENIQRIEKASSRAADLARQMLAYSGKGKFVVEPIDLNRLVEEMGHMLEVSISKKAILRYNLTHPLPAVEADATQIRQIVMNLVINASEAIGDKSGVISISTGAIDCGEAYLSDVWITEQAREGLYVFIEIADTGCGMDKETRDRIFDPFFTTKFTGRGLGMAAVMGIIRGHNGAIKVYSEPGKGSSFKVLLPACSLPAELFNGNDEAGKWEGSGVALLVDDEETVRAIGGEMLRELGFQVITAANGREALDIFRERRDINVIILDLTMPRMDGEQCFRELRILDPNVRVIMSSGFSESEVTQKFAGKGLAGFIQKPYKLSELRNLLKSLDERYHNDSTAIR